MTSWCEIEGHDGSSQAGTPLEPGVYRREWVGGEHYRAVRGEPSHRVATHGK